MERKICYFINFYLGKRRQDIDTYIFDNFCYLNSQIETLTRYKHSLSKIVFNFNVEPDHYENLSHAINLVPKTIQSTPIEINIRKNYGLSFGGFSDIFKKYMDTYDYYIFNEDDTVIVQDNFDEYLVTKFETLPNCGYLAGIVCEENVYLKHAGMSTGISSFEVLKKVFDVFGEIPHAKNNIYIDNEEYGQIEQTSSIVKLGYNIFDVREDYMVQFKTSQNIVYRYFIWNNEELFLPANVYFKEFYVWRDAIDSQYLRMESDVNSAKYYSY